MNFLCNLGLFLNFWFEKFLLGAFFPSSKWVFHHRITLLNIKLHKSILDFVCNSYYMRLIIDPDLSWEATQISRQIKFFSWSGTKFFELLFFLHPGGAVLSGSISLHAKKIKIAPLADGIVLEKSRGFAASVQK